MKQEFLEERMIEALRNSNIVEHIMQDAVLDSFDESAIRTLLKIPHTISYDSNGIFFLDLKGDRINCPNFATSISENGEWLSDKIPDVPFDIEQSGNIRKSIESESAYSCCIVSLIMKDEMFSNELDDVIKNYDFKEMSSKSGDLNFKDLLTSWQDLQSSVINVCISASKYKISNLKKDIEKFLKDGIPQDMEGELRSLDIIIKNINRSYSTGVLSPLNIRLLTKIEVLKELDDKNRKINYELSKSSVGTLYKVMRLSSEYIDPVDKKKLSRLANIEISNLYKMNPEYSTIIGEENIMRDRWRRRFFKYQRASIRKREVLKFCSDPGGYVLPPKM